MEEYGFTDFKFLFDLAESDYLSWNELKKLCKEYQNKHSDIISPAKIYKKMIEDKYDIPPIEMLGQLYDEYNSLKNLFSINL